MKVAGSVALVTGGAQGIGKAICHALLRKGAKVCVADCSDIGQQTVTEFIEQFGQQSSIFVKCDVRSLKDVESACAETVKAFGRIDIVANNSGIANEEDYEQTVDVNVTGVMHVLQTALSHMDVSKGGNGGVIINTASITGLGYAPISPTYFATKHAVVAYTRCYGDLWHYDRQKVRINCLCPSVVKTDLIKWAKSKSLLSREDFERASEAYGEPMRAEDVADAFITLVEDETKCGEALVLDPKAGFPYYHSFT